MMIDFRLLGRPDIPLPCSLFLSCPLVLPQKLASRPPSAVSIPSRPSSAKSGPSQELLDILETLGKISEGHNDLQKRVEVLEVIRSVAVVVYTCKTWFCCYSILRV